MDKLIIQVRVNEGTMRDKSPHVPYSPEEIAAQSIECYRAGASMVHYHCREPVTGKKSTDVGLYAETVRLIKKETDMITFPSLAAALLPTVKERLNHIVEMAKDPATKPDLIPVDMTSSNLTWYDPEKRDFIGDGDLLYRNTINMLRDLIVSTKAVGVKPVSMLWNVASIHLTEAFIEMGLYEGPVLCELAIYGAKMRVLGHEASIRGLNSFLDCMPQGHNWPWMADCLGVNAFAVTAAAIAQGGHAVIGVADYAYPELGYPTNAQMVAHVAEMARLMGREVATAAEAREIIGIA